MRCWRTSFAQSAQTPQPRASERHGNLTSLARANPANDGGRGALPTLMDSTIEEEGALPPLFQIRDVYGLGALRLS